MVRNFYFIFILFLSIFNTASANEKLLNPVQSFQQENSLRQQNQQEQISERNIPISSNLSKYAVEEDDIIFGNRKASVVLIEYFFPTCFHCVDYHKNIFPKLKRQYIDTGKIAYVRREFIGNKQDLDATILARCTRNIENYSKLMNLILEHQNHWLYSRNYRNILINIAGFSGISREKYEKCLNDEHLIKKLMNNTKILAKSSKNCGDT